MSEFTKDHAFELMDRGQDTGDDRLVTLGNLVYEMASWNERITREVNSLIERSKRIVENIEKDLSLNDLGEYQGTPASIDVMIGKRSMLASQYVALRNQIAKDEAEVTSES